MFGYGSFPPCMSTTASWYTLGSAAKYSLKSSSKLLRRMKAARSGYSRSVIAVADMPSAVVQQWHFPMSCSSVIVHFEPGLVRLIKKWKRLDYMRRELKTKKKRWSRWSNCMHREFCCNSTDSETVPHCWHYPQYRRCRTRGQIYARRPIPTDDIVLHVYMHLPSNEPAIEVDMFLGHGSLVEPEHVDVDLSSEANARFTLPLEYVECNQFHIFYFFILNLIFL